MYVKCGCGKCVSVCVLILCVGVCVLVCGIMCTCVWVYVCECICEHVRIIYVGVSVCTLKKTEGLNQPRLGYFSCSLKFH